MDLILFNLLIVQVTQVSILTDDFFFSVQKKNYVLNIASFNSEATFKFQVTKTEVL